MLHRVHSLTSNSLNIGLSDDPTNLNTGSDPYPGGIYQNAAYGSDYCDLGNAGTGTFRFKLAERAVVLGDRLLRH